MTLEERVARLEAIVFAETEEEMAAALTRTRSAGTDEAGATEEPSVSLGEARRAFLEKKGKKR